MTLRVLRVPQRNGDNGDDDLYVLNSSIPSPNEERSNNQDQTGVDEASSKIPATKTTTPSSDHHSAKAKVQHDERQKLQINRSNTFIPNIKTCPYKYFSLYCYCCCFCISLCFSLSSRLGRIRLLVSYEVEYNFISHLSRRPYRWSQCHTTLFTTIVWWQLPSRSPRHQRHVL